MSVPGVVRVWREEEGWGVVDSPATPGGCWAHFSHIAVAGYRTLVAGQRVELEHEAAQQDGYAHRAVRVWPAGTEPAPPDPPSGPSGAYRSWLHLEFDDGRPGLTSLPGMYATDRGIEELVERRGEEQVSVEWLADRLRVFVDLHPQYEDAVERVAAFLARDDADD